MFDFLPEFTASASFAGNASGPLTFGAMPDAGMSALLTPFFKGDKGERGVQGPDGIVPPPEELPDMTLIFDNGLV